MTSILDAKPLTVGDIREALAQFPADKPFIGWTPGCYWEVLGKPFEGSAGIFIELNLRSETSFEPIGELKEHMK